MCNGSGFEGEEEAKLDAELLGLFQHWIVYSEWFPNEDETEHLKITDKIEDFCELIHRRLAELVLAEKTVRRGRSHQSRHGMTMVKKRTRWSVDRV